MKKNVFFFILLCTLLGSISCHEQEEKRISPLGITSDNDDELQEQQSAFDLEEIQEAGELIAITLSGPETYFEYRGKGFGLQFELAEKFAVSVGARLRMETARDTAEMFRRLKQNEVDLIALEIPQKSLKDQELTQAGVWFGTDSTANGKKQWVIRKEAQFLAKALNNWYKPEIRTVLAANDRLRYSNGGGVKRHVRAPFMNRQKGIISPYDQHFIRHSKAIGWDWRLMAAQCYQESGFDPEALSWAGARGLMQIMPETAAHLGLPASQMHNPERNIQAAAQYLRELNSLFSDIPGRADRLQFVLAAYNGGPGHVRDAMTLARKHGKDERSWQNVAPFILKLSQPAFYNDPDVRFGYLRGSETYNYVISILQRWERYRRGTGGGGTPLSPYSVKPNTPHNFKSKVLSAEELEEKYKQKKETE